MTVQPEVTRRLARGSDQSGSWPGLPTERLLSIAEAAELLAVPPSWLRDKVTARQVPHTRLGRHVRFTPDQLRRIIAASEASAETGEGPGASGGRRRKAGPHLLR